MQNDGKRTNKFGPTKKAFKCRWKSFRMAKTSSEHNELYFLSLLFRLLVATTLRHLTSQSQFSSVVLFFGYFVAFLFLENSNRIELPVAAHKSEHCDRNKVKLVEQTVANGEKRYKND